MPVCAPPPTNQLDHPAVVRACRPCAVFWLLATGTQIGQLLSAFGVCTMFAEGVLVRWMVPKLGEKLTLQIGLLGFAAQCVLLGLAHSEWMVFASMGG